MAHQHRSASERPWLPSLDSGLLRPHPYCAYCGAVKNVSSDKARGIGYYFNALAQMKRYLEKRGSRLSSAQVRLISLEMEGNGYANAYSTPGSSQRGAFVEIVRKYTSLSPCFIKDFIYPLVYGCFFYPWRLMVKKGRGAKGMHWKRR